MVQWAPLSLPIARRRQTFAVLLWIFLYPLLLSFFALLVYYQPLLAMLYLIYIVLDPVSETGGRPNSYVRNLFFWHWLKDYFPVQMVLNKPLDPTRNYLFGYHPHGIIGLGAFISFGTNATGIEELIPGVRVRLLTLALNFRMPIVRDLLLSLGLCSVSKKSVETILTKGPGHSCTIVIGGASESLYAFPGTANLVLKRRMGFIKMAIKTGADLVPIFAFGENEIWNQLESKKGSLLHTFQKRLQQWTAVAFPLFHGRGIFQYDIGLMPHRRPIVVVIGDPIPCPKNKNPSQELLQEYQEKYLKGLEKVYHQYKDQYAKDRKSEIHFIE